MKGKKCLTCTRYRVTPIFDGNNLLATGVLIEAMSMEDNGDGICFKVFCYNEQPGIIIDHSNGDKRELDGILSSTDSYKF